ncbi:hypothetical protein ACFPRL_04790 [Pseudoclavibacter helvolus]
MPRRLCSSTRSRACTSGSSRRTFPGRSRRSTSPWRSPTTG